MPTADRRLRLCYLIGSLKIGGAQRHLVTLMDRLDPERFQVFLAMAREETPSLEGTGGGRSGRLVLELDRYYDATGVRGLFRLAGFLREHGIDILHTYLFECNVYGALCKFLCPEVSLVMSVRNMNDGHGRLRVRSIRAASWLSDRVTAVSDRVARRLAERERVNPGKLVTLPNAVDTEFFSPPASGREGREGRPTVILCVASLNRRKGHDTLLRAFRLLRESAGPVLLRLVGDGPERPRLEGLAADLGVAPDVRFEGRREDVLPALLDADVFVLPSLEEGMSNALLEAMSTALPAVVTDVGGNAEVVETGSSGLLVPSRDEAALAQALERLVLDPSLRAVIGRGARARVRSRFSVERMVDDYQRFYVSLALERTAGRARAAQTRRPEP